MDIDDCIISNFNVPSNINKSNFNIELDDFIVSNLKVPSNIIICGPEKYL